ncbi:MAG: twin-arginine translocase TatA/TatE family subunit [Chthonomonas sp.]|nr:twin-arginine translocase TatA/TatE family subunit [Chthonomonas sp.]
MNLNSLFASFFGGGQEWLVVLLIVLLLFGGAKIPQLMRGVGKGMGELQKGLEEGRRSLDQMKEADTSNETSTTR